MAPSRCPRCTSPMVEIALTLRENDLTMESCSKCGIRSWRRQGEVIDLNEVAPVTRARQTA